MTIFVAIIPMNLFTPKVGAEHELLHNDPEADSFNRCSCLSPTLGIIMGSLYLMLVHMFAFNV